MPNTFAYAMLFIWPVVTIVLFRTRPLNEALAWTIIGGYLLLPERAVAFDLPLLPAWDKTLVPSLFAAIMCALAVSSNTSLASVRKVRSTDPRGTENKPNQSFAAKRGNLLFIPLAGLLFFAPFATVLTNTEPQIGRFEIRPGLDIYEGFSYALNILVLTLPFFLGRRFLRTKESHIVLLKVLVVAALSYSFLALYEIRMSPQLNRTIYGFFPHSFIQHIRGGGFRPLVFLNHGIWLAIFFAMSILASATLWKTIKKQPISLFWLLACLWLLMTLVLSKSLTALLVVLLLLTLLFVSTKGFQLLVAAAISACVLIYPALRGADLVPTDQIYSAIATMNKERADSLQYRFNAEEQFLAHANRKPIAGWGGRNRNRGDFAEAADGYWVLVVGSYGWLGYLAQFSMLGLASILIALKRNRIEIPIATTGLMIVLSAALIDLIPNASISPIVWLIAGALTGYYQTAKAKQAKKSFDNAGNMYSLSSITRTEKGRDKTEQNLAVERQLHKRLPREG